VSTFTELLSQPLAERLGWALVHFLWQGALVAGLLVVVLRILRAASAEARYLAGCAALAVMAGLPVVTLLCLPARVPSTAPSPVVMEAPIDRPISSDLVVIEPFAVTDGDIAASETPIAAVPVSSSEFSLSNAPAEVAVSWAELVNGKLRPWIPWFVAAWLAGVLFLSLRLLASWRSAQRMRLVGTLAASDRLISLMSQIAEQFGVRRSIDLLESTAIEVPAAIGWLRPVILLPVSAITGLTESQLKAILAHELAHIRRCDYLVNLGQSVVETLLFYHPAVWWVSSQIRQEREHCCDDLAGTICGDRVGYAQALVRMEELRGLGGNVALAASGGRLTDRVRRLIGVRSHDRVSAWWLGGAMAMVVATVVVTGLWWTSAVTASPPAEMSEAPIEAVEEVDGQETETADGDQEAPWRVRLRAIDEATGKPISAAEFVVQLGEEETAYESDDQGEFVAELPTRNPRFCNLKCKASGYVPMRAIWRNSGNASNDELPEELTFPMGKAVSVGGIVLNDASEPVQGALVEFRVLPDRGSQSARRIAQYTREECQTDEDGRWICESAPPDMNLATIHIDHPGYARDGEDWGLNGRLDALRAMSLVVYLHKAYTLRGRVTDHEGKPVAGAVLMQGGSSGLRERPFYESDADGRFSISRASFSWLAGVKSGFAPVKRESPFRHLWGPFEPAEVPEEIDEISIQMERAAKVTFKVTDTDGNPVPGVWIVPSLDGNPDYVTTLSHRASPNRETDENGMWTWDSAPKGKEIYYDLARSGYMAVRDFRRMAFEDAVFEVTLKRPQIIRGRVVDAETKQPIEGFVVQKGWLSGQWDTSTQTRGHHGKYTKSVASPPRNSFFYRYRVQAEGYEPAVSEVVKYKEGEVTVNFGLKRVEARPEWVAEFGEPVGALAEDDQTEALLTVKVYDRVTGKPIERFRVVPGSGSGGYGYAPFSDQDDPANLALTVWYPDMIRECTKGLFRWPADRSQKIFRLRFEADGYIPEMSHWIKKSDGKQEFDVAMRRDPGISGQVLTPDGQPAAGTVLAVTMPNRPVQLQNAEFVGVDARIPANPSDRWRRPIFAKANQEGRFRVGMQVGPVLVYAVHDSGIAEVPFKDLQESPNIRLHPWAAMDGRVVWVDKPGANEELLLAVKREFGDYPTALLWQATATTNAQGRFHVDKLPPWTVKVSRRFEMPEDRGEFFYPSQEFELAEGKSTSVVFGGRGRPVVGKLIGLKPGEEVTIQIEPFTPDGPRGHDNWLARALVYQSSCGPKLFRTKIPVAEDGTFRIDNVLPAHYQLIMKGPSPRIFAASRFTVEPMPGGESDELHDLGEIQVRRR
jgi:beta-lactamase regulating signal transducer with metallopeptidase domain/protocatechuate 3,4-dioxygenase beta subunit